MQDALFKNEDIWVTLHILFGIPIWGVFDGNTLLRITGTNSLPECLSSQLIKMSLDEKCTKASEGIKKILSSTTFSECASLIVKNIMDNQFSSHSLMYMQGCFIKTCIDRSTFYRSNSINVIINNLLCMSTYFGNHVSCPSKLNPDLVYWYLHVDKDKYHKVLIESALPQPVPSLKIMTQLFVKENKIKSAVPSLLLKINFK